MKNFLKQISIIIISGVLIIASGGFGLIHHYCGCTQDENISILTENSCCLEDMNEQCCDIESYTESISCCLINNPQNQTHNHCDEDEDCCSSEYFYFKTDNFDLSGNKRVNLDFTIAYMAVIQETQNQELLSEGFIFQINNNLPPPDFGKKLLYSLHRLKIASPLV